MLIPTITVLSDNIYCSSNHQTISESAYKLVNKPIPSDVKMEKNPAYSVTDMQDTSADYHYDFIADNGHAKLKVKKQI